MKAFTLIETLVAIAVFTIVLGAPFYAIEESIKAADVARDQLTASYLAQEGTEFVRSIRDDNYLYLYQNSTSHRTWLFRLDGTYGNGTTGGTDCFKPNVCTLDPVNDYVIPYTSVTLAPPLYFNQATGLYTETAGGNTATAFTRTVQLIPVSGSNIEDEVIVTVSWTTHTIPYSTSVSEYLDDWLPGGTSS